MFQTFQLQFPLFTGLVIVLFDPKTRGRGGGEDFKTTNDLKPSCRSFHGFSHRIQCPVHNNRGGAKNAYDAIRSQHKFMLRLHVAISCCNQMSIFQLDFPFWLLSISQNWNSAFSIAFFWVGFPVSKNGNRKCRIPILRNT